MPLSDEAASEEVQLTLAALTNRFSIVTSTETLQSKQRGEFILAHLECGCRWGALSSSALGEAGVMSSRHLGKPPPLRQLVGAAPGWFGPPIATGRALGP